MNINLTGGSRPEISDDDLLKEFCERVWDDPGFADRVKKTVLPWQPNCGATPGVDWIRTNICGALVTTSSRELSRASTDDVIGYQGYHVLNKVKHGS